MTTLRAALVDARDPVWRAPWEELAACALEANPFFEPEAVLPAVELLPEGGRVRLLVVHDDQGLLLALPVLRSRYRRVPLPAVGSWQHAHCFVGTALLSPRRPVEAWQVALGVLRADRSERWLVLPRTAVDGPVGRALLAALDADGVRATLTDLHDRPVVHRRSQDDYLDERLGSRSRKNLRRHARRLAEELGGELVVTDGAADPQGVPAAVQELLAMERAGWKGRAGTAMACDPAVAAWFSRLCTGFAAAGRLQLFALGVPGRPAALQVNLLAGDTVFHHKVAYDEQLARFSPGLQLDLAMVEDFHQDLRWQTIDSCADPGPSSSARLYPDRTTLATVLVPLDRGVGRLAARSTPAALHLLRAGRDRLPGRRRSAPAEPAGPEEREVRQ